MKEENKYFLDEAVRISFNTECKHHFFGYYDKCPWSKDGRFLLALETDFWKDYRTEKTKRISES